MLMLSSPTTLGAADAPPMENGTGLSAACTGTAGETTDVCMGFLRGTLHGLSAVGDYPFFCLPEPVPFGAVRDAVVTFMSNNPKALQGDSASVIRTALARAYPCSTDHLFPRKSQRSPTR